MNNMGNEGVIGFPTFLPFTSKPVTREYDLKLKDSQDRTQVANQIESLYAGKVRAQVEDFVIPDEASYIQMVAKWLAATFILIACMSLLYILMQFILEKRFEIGMPMSVSSKIRPTTFSLMK